MSNASPKREGLLYGLIKRIRRFLDFIAALGILVSKERRHSARIGIFKKIKSWRSGFLSTSYLEYDLEKNDRSKYISDYQRWVSIPRINEKYGILIADKLLINDVLHPYKSYLPDVYYYIINGVAVKASHQVKGQELETFMRDQQVLVFKPRSGHGGRGVFVYEKNVQGSILLNGKQFTQEQFDEWLLSLDNYIIMEFVSQRGYASNIFAETLNTVRILTICDPQTKTAHIAAAAHRFGTKSTIPADNWTAGGISTNIDLKTGVLSKSAINPKGNKIEWISEHPNSGKKIDGVEIPNWKHACNKICEIAEYLHYCPYIG
ncbi:sugar-transfer associated ATP-grasp domain-containing protein, partial [Fulvivirga lutimaris]|uniref:sugar-transfer associated ATP-grasp domain-containing protein n=1 Tax=Fulvivirga lutimaris TaxID=1819566 RepID=UPI0012BCE1B3